jgi:hypothetical protein
LLPVMESGNKPFFSQAYCRDGTDDKYLGTSSFRFL